MIDLASVLFVILMHLSYIGLGLCWAGFQDKSSVVKLSRCETLFKHWAVGVCFSIVLLYGASFLHLYWIVFGVLILLGSGNLVRHLLHERSLPRFLSCCKMQQGRTAAGRSRYFKNLPLFIVIMIPCILSVCLFILYANLALNSQVHGVSGMGNWALKSKIIFLEPGLYSSYFDHATHYGKFSYPPGFPLLNAPLFLIHGAEHDIILKLNSILHFAVLFVFTSYLFIQNWKHYALIPIIMSLGFFLGDAAWTVSYWLYSEPMLILCCAISTLLFLRGDLASSLITASGASMIKQEGVIFLLLIVMACLLFTNERKRMFLYSFLAIAPYLSWKIITSLHGINDSDFDFSVSNFSQENLTHAYRSVLESAIGRWESYSGVITLLPLLILYSVFYKKWKVQSALAIALGLMVFYIVALSFTSIEDIEWHLSATTRYMMLPTVIIIVCMSFLSFQLRKRENDSDP